jgi:hypothetical protein
LEISVSESNWYEKNNVFSNPAMDCLSLNLMSLSRYFDLL